MVNFLYNLYIFVWIQHSCSANTVFTSDPSYSAIKMLECMFLSRLYISFHMVFVILFLIPHVSNELQYLR